MNGYAGCITTVLTLGLFIMLPAYIVNAIMGVDFIATWQWILIIVGVVIVAIYWIVVLNKERNSSYKLIYNKNTEINELNKDRKQLSEQIDKQNKQIDTLNAIIRTKTPFSFVGQMYADAHNSIFEEDRTYMIRRQNQLSTIERLAEHKKKINELEKQNKILEYQYNALIEHFFKEVKSNIKSEENLLDFLTTTNIGKYIQQLEAISRNSRQTAIQSAIDAHRKIEDSQRKVENTISECNNKIRVIQNKCDEIEALIASKTPFSAFANLITKLDSLDYDAASWFLRYKSPPAPATADKIEKEFKQEYIKYRNACEEMMAKYEFLFSVFPDLKLYVDDEISLISLSDISTIGDFEEETDRVVNYLSADEYNNLSRIERNQLALDRYVRKEKDVLTIGLEYEMYVDYWLREKKGFNTIPHGIIYGVKDLGRDIIAWRKSEKELFNEVFVIQCKLRSQDTVIHENVICQIYGSAIEYELENPDKRVIPTICTNVSLSETAKRFADKLKVFVLRVPMGNFPRIKCNINNGEKIYHLPFDQQYWRTQIKNKDEFYAWTVQEAENNNFRRARRHHPFTN